MADEKEVKIQADSVNLYGILTIPKGAKSLVIFAHGSGSSRLSPRNRFVGGLLQKAGMGTLLFDLLTAKEDEIYENRFGYPVAHRTAEGCHSVDQGTDGDSKT